jgi:Arc/MetJ-type ribon-helix-helix transcriptional regulator
MKTTTKVIAARIPEKFVKKISELVTAGNFINQSEFIRAAIREKLQSA